MMHDRNDTDKPVDPAADLNVSGLSPRPPWDGPGDDDGPPPPDGCEAAHDDTREDTGVANDPTAHSHPVQMPPPKAAAEAAKRPIDYRLVGYYARSFPTPAIPGPGVALAFAARLLSEADGYLLVMVRKAKWSGPHRELIVEGDAVMGGYFSELGALAFELGRLDAELPVSVNPNLAVLGGRMPRNTLLPLGRGQAVGKEHIEIIRYLIIDTDPVWRKPGENSRDCQHRAVLAMMRGLLAAEPEVAASALAGSFGNGAHMLIRLPDLANNPENWTLLRWFVRRLADKYPQTTIAIPEGEIIWPDIDRFTGAKIDTDYKVTNTIGLPGSWKCKDVNTPIRPRREVTLDGPLDRHLGPFDPRAWLAANFPGETGGPDPEPADSGLVTTVPVPGETARRMIDRARRRLRRRPGAVEGRRGGCYTYGIICNIIRDYLFGLDADRVLEAVGPWNKRCERPWAEDELRRMVGYAIAEVKAPRDTSTFADFDWTDMS
jgi:hypothetical protein